MYIMIPSSQWVSSKDGSFCRGVLEGNVDNVKGSFYYLCYRKDYRLKLCLVGRERESTGIKEVNLFLSLSTASADSIYISLHCI